MKPSQEYLEAIKKKLSSLNVAAGLPENPGETKRAQRDLDSMDFFDVMGSASIKWMKENKKDQK
jgi:hypothetical protein